MRQLGVGEAVLVQAVALKVLIGEEVGQVVVLVVGVVGLVEEPQERWGCVLPGLRVYQLSSC